MLASLFKQDDVLYRIIPVSSVQELQDVKEEFATYAEVRFHQFRPSTGN
jgi:cell division control protein 45